MNTIASNGIAINTGEAVLVRNSTNGTWLYTNFSHEESNSYIVSNSCSYSFCVPYKGNENLVGTTDNFIKETFNFKFGAKVRASAEIDEEVEEPIGILIGYDKNDRYYKYKVAFPTSDDRGDVSWFAKIEYVE